MSSIKKYFVSRWGNSGFIVEFDYSQIEIIAQAFLTKDQQMYEDIRNNVDFHVKRLAYKEKVPYEHAYSLAVVEEVPEWVAKRKHIKAFSFQRSYGAGAPAIAEALGLPVKEIRAFIEAEEKTYPGVVKAQKAWQASVQRARTCSGEVTKKGLPAGLGTLVAPTGARYTFLENDAPDWMVRDRGIQTSFAPQQIKNYPIQGFAAVLLKLAQGAVLRLVLAPTYRKHVKLVNTVHDSIIFDIHETFLDEICPKIKSAMLGITETFESRFGVEFDLPLSVDIESGRNWLEIKTYGE